MPQPIIDKVFNDLEEIKFSGLVSLFNNNDALIDKRLEEIVALSKKRFLLAKTHVLTNGKLLTFKRFESLHKSGLDRLAIDNYYSDKPVLNKPIADFIKEFNASPYRDTVDIKVYMRYKNEVLDSRAGNSPNKKSAS